MTRQNCARRYYNIFAARTLIVCRDQLRHCCNRKRPGCGWRFRNDHADRICPSLDPLQRIRKRTNELFDFTGHSIFVLADNMINAVNCAEDIENLHKKMILVVFEPSAFVFRFSWGYQQAAAA